MSCDLRYQAFHFWPPNEAGRPVDEARAASSPAVVWLTRNAVTEEVQVGAGLLKTVLWFWSLWIPTQCVLLL